MKRKLEKMNLEKFNPLNPNEMKQIMGGDSNPTYWSKTVSQTTYVTPGTDTWSQSTLHSDQNSEVDIYAVPAPVFDDTPSGSDPGVKHL